MEHRWGCRTLIDKPVRIAAATHISTARLRDISASGAFLCTHLTAAFRGRVQVQFQLPSNGTSECTVEALVARKAPDGIGVEWMPFSPTSVSHIIQAYSRDRQPDHDILDAAVPNAPCPSSRHCRKRPPCNSATLAVPGEKATLIECSRRQHRRDSGSYIDLATLLRHPAKALKRLLRALSCYFAKGQDLVARRPCKSRVRAQLGRTVAR
jgi:hypothetical protein